MGGISPANHRSCLVDVQRLVRCRQTDGGRGGGDVEGVGQGEDGHVHVGSCVVVVGVLGDVGDRSSVGLCIGCVVFSNKNLDCCRKVTSCAMRCCQYVLLGYERSTTPWHLLPRVNKPDLVISLVRHVSNVSRCFKFSPSKDTHSPRYQCHQRSLSFSAPLHSYTEAQNLMELLLLL